VEELAKESNPDHIRQLAGLQLKNTVDARSDQAREVLKNRWLHVQPEIRNQIKTTVRPCPRQRLFL